MEKEIILQRQFYNELLKWKRLDKGRTALLVEGARRVGKTTIVKEFAKNEYDDFLVIDFSAERNRSERVFGLIGDRKEDMDDFFRQLFVLVGRNSPLPAHHSLIIFDEIQFFPLARQAIKFLVKDGRYDYVETGSLVSIKSNSSGILIPSEEISSSMHPLSFGEFLMNTGNSLLLEEIVKAYEEKKPLPDDVHHMANMKLREYLLVGGMPQAVVSYMQGEDYSRIDRVKRAIIHLYRDDIAKEKQASKTRSIYDDIPTQLTHHGKHFIFGRTDKRYRLSNTYKAFDYIEEAMIGRRCFDVDDPEYALSMSKKSDRFRLYSSDPGLYVTQCYEAEQDFSGNIYRKLLQGRLSSNEGTIAETYVASQLSCNGRPLYYHTFKVKDSSSVYEIDFLIGKEGKVCPIEVKSGDNLSHVSLDKFKEKYGKKIGMKYVLSFKNLSRGNDVLYLPLYMAFLL